MKKKAIFYRMILLTVTGCLLFMKMFPFAITGKGDAGWKKEFTINASTEKPPVFDEVFNWTAKPGIPKSSETREFSPPQDCATLQSQLTARGQFLPNPLPPGCVNTPYSQAIAFRWKKDTVLFGQTIPFDSVMINGVSNLPAGISFTGCSAAGCKYILYNDSTGCLNISGTPTATYSGNVQIAVTYFITIFGSPQSIQEVTELPLTIHTAGSCSFLSQCETLQSGLTNRGQFLPNPLPEGCINNPYDQLVVYKWKKDTVLFGQTISFDSVKINSVTSLPAGINFGGCTVGGCNYILYNDSTGCLTISGLPTSVYNDSIDIAATYFLTIFGSPVSFSEIIKLPLKINSNCSVCTPATANAGTDYSVCATATTFPPLAGSIGGSATIGTWSGGSGTFSPNATSLNATYIPSATELANPGVPVVLTLTTDDPPGTCTAASDQVHLSINEPAILNAGTDQTVCSNDTLFLHATISGAASNMVWQLNSAFGNFVGPDTNPDAKFVLNAAGRQLSSLSFGAQTNDPAGPCSSALDTVIFFINPGFTANAGPDYSICATSTSFPPLNGVTTGTGSGGTWSGGSGSFSPNATTLNAVYIPSASELANPGIPIVLTLTTNDPAGTCTAASDQVQLIINEGAILNAGTDQTICNTDTIDLHAIISGAATNMVWQLNSAFGSFVGPDTSPDAKFVLNAAGRQLSSLSFGAQTNDPAGVCPSALDTVIIFINPIPAVIATPSSQSVCSGAPINTIVLSGGVAGTTYNWTRNNNGTVTGIAASGSGNIGGQLTNTTTSPVTVTFTITSASVPCSGTTTTATVIVNPAPVVTCPGNIVVSNTTGQCSAPVSYSTTVTGVPTPTFSYSFAGATTGTGSGNGSGAVFNVGLTTVTVTASNSCTSSTCSFTIRVNDTQVPVINCPAPVTVSCANAVPAPNPSSVSASDNCPGLSVAHVSDVISGLICANRFTITRTYRVTDAAGNTATCAQIITVNDQSAPVLTCPAPVTVSCTNAIPAVNTAAVTGVSDNCGGVVTVTHISDVISNQTCANRYTVTRTYRATDLCRNFTDCTQLITVNDQTAPVITCPAPVTVTTPVGSCTAVVNYTVTASDNCNGPVTIVSLPASGTAFPIGMTTVTATATDACGNSSTCTFTVTVLDGQLPVISAQPVSRTVCVGSNAVFTVTATNVISYQWQQFNGTGWVNIAGANTPIFTINNATLNQNTNTFRVVLTGLCSVVNSNAATLFVNPLPSVQVSAAPTQSLLPGQSTTITATVNPGGGNFNWLLNGNSIAGINVPVLGPLTVDEIGTYQVVYTDPNGCINRSPIIELTGQVSDKLWVYPNPNHGKFTVRYFNSINETLSLNIYNTGGRKVFQQQFTTSTPYSLIAVDLGSSQGNGIFIVEVINASGKKVGVKQIIVQIP